VKFTVLGEPIPQGSAKAFYVKSIGRAVVTHANAKTKTWRTSIADAASTAKGDARPLEGVAVEVHVVFYLPRPASAPKRVTEPAKKPDVDKLLRAILDGITDAGVWRDDAQVIAAFARKAFAGGVHDPLGVIGTPRAVVEVRVADPLGPFSSRQRTLEGELGKALPA
jgi:Holliday junction resolvase RusA-like endonuclease